jgi:signal recognition particle receptor subunit beta
MGVLSRLFEKAKVRRSFANTHDITPVVIAITKHDLATDWSDESMLTRTENFAKEKGIHLCLTSAKNDTGISDAFSSIFESLVKNTIRKPRLMGWKE